MVRHGMEPKAVFINGKSVFRGKILLDVRVNTMRLPNGKIVKIESIKHPGAACVIPFLAEDKVILIRQYRPVINGYIWEIPAGTLKKGERPIRCAKRELEEEISYSAGVIEPVGFVYTTPGFTNEKIHIFRAGSLKKINSCPEADEILSVKVFKINEIEKMLKNGGIVDAKTIAGLAMCGIV